MKSGKINRTLILSSILFLLTLSLISSISALGVYPLCLTKGQVLRFSLCNPTIPDRVCTTSICQYCINEISPGIYCPASLNACNNGDQTCIYITNQNTTAPPPIKVNITEPVNNYSVLVSSTNSILFKYKVTNYTKISSCNLFVNEVSLASNQSKISSSINTIQINLNPHNPGNYSWYIRCTNKTGSSFYSEHRTLTIYSPNSTGPTTPTFYNVNLLSPSDQFSVVEGPVSFSFNLLNLSNSTLKTCNLLINDVMVSSINSSSAITNTTNSTNSTIITSQGISNTLNTFTQTFTPGSYYWNIICINKVSKNYSSEKRLLTITSNTPTTPPAAGGGSSGSSSGGGGGGGGGGSSSLPICLSSAWNCTKWTDCKNSSSTRVCTLTKTNCQAQAKPEETLKCINADSISSESNSSLTNSSSDNNSLSENQSSTSIFPKAITGITGAVVGSLSEKKVFIPIIFIVSIVALMVIIQMFRKKK